MTTFTRLPAGTVNGIEHLLRVQIHHREDGEGQGFEAGGVSYEELEDRGADFAAGIQQMTLEDEEESQAAA